MKYTKIALAALISSATLFTAQTASAAEIKSSFNVKVAISPLCTLRTIDDVDFGVADAATPTQIRSTNITVKCNDAEGYTIALRPSDNNGVGQGIMLGAANGDQIIYNMYKDAAATSPWGATGANQLTDTGNGAMQTHSVYVRVQGAEFANARTDHYNDVVSVVVTY